MEIFQKSEKVIRALEYDNSFSRVVIRSLDSTNLIWGNDLIMLENELVKSRERITIWKNEYIIVQSEGTIERSDGTNWLMRGNKLSPCFVVVEKNVLQCVE